MQRGVSASLTALGIDLGIFNRSDHTRKPTLRPLFAKEACELALDLGEFCGIGEPARMLVAEGDLTPPNLPSQE